MNNYTKSKGSDIKQNAGFALIASLSIMAVLVLIAVALFSLASVATRSAEIAAARAKAQANARMALMVALGDLQKNLGPDQRISARSLTLAQHPNFDTPVDIEPDSPNAWWVGVSSTVKIEDSDEIEELESDKSVVWLLSGLNPNGSSEDQLGEGIFPSLRKVTMFGENSIDLSLTGGIAIEAGAVPVFANGGVAASGSYAYFVDDNGMKAQLVASNPDLTNEDQTTTRPGGTAIPGSYDLSILDGMDGFTGTAVADYLKINSLDELPLIGGDAAIARDKRLSYTTRSFGVLADVKNGGLKKDLTIAFENHRIDPGEASHPFGGEYPNWPVYEVFDQTLAADYNDSIPRDNDWGDYLVVDESKRDEFGANGYIHWAMFRDHYNIKRYIRSSNDANKGANGAMEWLDPSVFHRVMAKSDWHKIAPHDMGPDVGGSDFELGATDSRFGGPGPTQGFPYSNYPTVPNTENNPRYGKEFPNYYKHSPVITIMSKLQLNARMDVEDQDGTPFQPVDPNNPDVVSTIRTKSQAFTSFYNAYNIGLRYQNPDRAVAAFASNEYPNASIYFPDGAAVGIVERRMNNHHMWARNNGNGSATILAAKPGEDQSWSTTTGAPVYVGPGRAITIAMSEDANLDENSGLGTMSYTIQNVLENSRYIDVDLTQTPTTLDFEIHFKPRTGMSIGTTGNAWSHSQRHATLFAREYPSTSSIGGPGIIIDVPPTGIGPNSRGSVSYKLRSTTESDDNSLRPLVDANIRALLVNPRYDSPLGLETSAAYIVDDDELMSQVPQMLTTTDGDGSPIGFTYWGAADNPQYGYDRVILFDIPRKDLVSLGQLQHANAGRFSYEPSYIVGNSYANPRISLDDWKESITDTFAVEDRGFRSGGDDQIPDTFDIYDASYLVNEALWDSFIFTTIPQNADNYDDPDEPEVNADLFTALRDRTAHLANPRFIPYEPAGSTFDLDTLQEIGDEDKQSAFYHNAGHLLVDGAFNVNSTSIDAWEAFLMGTYGMPYQKIDRTGEITGYEPVSDSVRFPRVESVFGEPFNAGGETQAGYWTGFRALSPTEVRNLAVEIVNQIIERGPFLTLGDFVNRKLEIGDLGEKGALQAALDATVNSNPSAAYSSTTLSDKIPSNENQAAGFPGQLLQGDILQALSPFMTVRSDTFTIRAYGDSISPGDNEVTSQAWCEAVVQRIPDPVSPDTNTQYVRELAEPSSPYGRQFRIVSFRWLSEEEI